MGDRRYDDPPFLRRSARALRTAAASRATPRPTRSSPARAPTPSSAEGGEEYISVVDKFTGDMVHCGPGVYRRRSEGGASAERRSPLSRAKTSPGGSDTSSGPSDTRRPGRQAGPAFRRNTSRTWCVRCGSRDASEARIFGRAETAPRFFADLVPPYCNHTAARPTGSFPAHIPLVHEPFLPRRGVEQSGSSSGS